MSEAAKWYLTKDGGKEGPFPSDEVARRLKAKEIDLDALAFTPGFSEWRPLRDIPEFATAAPPSDDLVATVAVEAVAPARPAPPPSPAQPALDAPVTPASTAPVPEPAPKPKPKPAPEPDPPADVTHDDAEVGGSTIRLSVSLAGEYSRLNFVLRLIGLYYILYVAHLALWVGYSYASGLVSMLDLILALITGRHHRGLVSYLQRFVRFHARMVASVMGLTEAIPHIDVNARGSDFPVDVTLEPGMRIGTGAVILRLSGVVGILLFPHLLALGVLGIVGFLAFVAGLFAVIFTGTWPGGIHDFLVGLLRWGLRVFEYATGLSVQYPQFGLK